jgi:hypothetical protein
VLLLEAELLALIVAVIRIQHTGQRLSTLLAQNGLQYTTNSLLATGTTPDSAQHRLTAATLLIIDPFARMHSNQHFSGARVELPPCRVN